MPDPLLLLVEDSRPIANAIAAYIAALPRAPQVMVASSGEDALALCQDVTPDFAVVDVQLPGVQGTRVVEVLRASSDSMRIIGTSVDARLAVREAMLQAGADVFVSKADLHAELHRRFG